MNTSMRISNELLGLPPKVATRPSGSSTAEEWYTRATLGAATFVHVLVVGWKIRALSTGVPENTTDFCAPPVWSTVESGSTTALTYILLLSIDGPGVNVGFGALRSAIAVELTALTSLE